MVSEQDAQTAPSTDGLADALGVNVGDAMMEALVGVFWSAPVVGFHPPPMGPNGTPIGNPMPIYGESPAAGVARRIYAENGTELIAKVVERIDLDELAGKIADRTVEEISKVDRPWSGQPRLSPSAQDISERVREKVAEQLSERVRADYDRRQAEMYAAWERDQARQREQAALEQEADSAAGS